MNYYLKAWKDFAKFNGRSRRAEYWVFKIVNTLILMVMGFIIISTESAGEAVSGGVTAIIAIGVFAMVIPTLAVTVRRMHDISLTGWFVLVKIVPFFGNIALFVMCCIDGKPEPNQYGESPKYALNTQMDY